MAAWFKRFGLHMAAAIGATGIFVAAAAVGANQTRQQGESALGTLQATAASPATTPIARAKPSVVRTPAPTQIPPAPTPAPTGPPLAQASPPPTQASPPLAQASPPLAQASQPDLDETPPAAVAPQPGPPAAAAPVTQAQPAPQPQGPPTAAAPKPSQPRRTPTPAPSPTPAPEKVAPERSLAGTITDVLPDALDVIGVGGREWHVVPAPGALIRLNGKSVPLDLLHVGDTVVILGQAQAKQGALYGFLAHAVTARRK